jgi:hypothetical protein
VPWGDGLRTSRRLQPGGKQAIQQYVYIPLQSFCFQSLYFQSLYFAERFASGLTAPLT